MKHPTFNAVGISKCVQDKKSNNLAVHLVDKDRTQVVNFSPESQRSLLLALLSRPPAEPDIGLVDFAKALHLRGTRPFRLQDENLCGLEMLVGQNMAIHVLFPPEAISSIRTSLDQLSMPGPLKGDIKH